MLRSGRFMPACYCAYNIQATISLRENSYGVSLLSLLRSSFLSRYSALLRWIPACRAAALTLPLCSANNASQYARSKWVMSRAFASLKGSPDAIAFIACSLALSFEPSPSCCLLVEGGSRYFVSSRSFVASIAARSTKFLSSRILPGQLCLCSFRMVS